MLRPAAIAATLVTAAIVRQAPPAPSIVGTWQLVSRTGRDSTGGVLSARGPGKAPIGYLIYDAAADVAAQLAARDRSGLVCDSTGQSPDRNNNAKISGYSAHSGRYEIGASTGSAAFPTR